MLRVQLALFLFLFAWTPMAQALNYRLLRSSEGTDIAVRFRLQAGTSDAPSTSNVIYAKPLEFSVGRDGLGPQDKARVVLMNRVVRRNRCEGTNSVALNTYALDLKFMGGFRNIFYGRFENSRRLVDGREVPLDLNEQKLVVKSENSCEEVLTTQEIAVVVNGEWQTDPVSRKHNFKFTLFGQ